MQMGDDKMKDTLKDVCATFLSIVLFFCIVGLSSILVFQNLITKENIKQMVKNTDFTTDVKNRAETKQMEDIFSNIYIVADKYHIPEQFIDNVFNDEITKEFLGTVAANVIDETLTGPDEKVLTAEDLNELLENNMEHFQEVSNIQLTEQQEENFLNLVNEHSTTIIEILPTTTELQTYMNPDMIEGLKILNPSEIVAEEVKKYLEENQMTVSKAAGKSCFYASDMSDSFLQMIKKILGNRDIEVKYKNFSEIRTL